MSILTFGVGQTNQAVRQAGGISEELRDERLNQRLQQAFALKQAQKHKEALECYSSVLEDQTLLDAKIDKHVFMLYNAHKNIGEVYEKLLDFQLAKIHYTHALKIQPKDAFIWTRLGYLQFEHFQDLVLSQQCFEAATKTLSTLEKRGNKICPILVKLAEISFLDFNYRKSEQIVDTILGRPQSDQKSLLFALLMKSYFARLHNQITLSEECMERADAIQSGVKLTDLQVMKKKADSMLIKQKQALVYSPAESRFVAIDGNSQLENPKLTLSLEGLSPAGGSFPEFFLCFIQAMGAQLEAFLDQESAEKSLDLVLDCQAFREYLEKNGEQMLAKWSESFSNFSAAPADDWNVLEQQDSQDNKGNKAGAITKQATQPPKKAADGARRGLRRKLDGNDAQMKQLKLQSLEKFKEHVISQNEDQFLQVSSQREIFAIKGLFEKKSSGRQQTQSKDEQATNDQGQESATDDCVRIPETRLLGRFLEILTHIQGRSVFYVIRNLLRFIVDDEGWPLLSDRTAYDIFRLFQLVIRVNKSSSRTIGGQDMMDQFGSYQVILVMFELVLFNQSVIKKAKSGPIMAHGKQLYNYFEQFASSAQQAEDGASVLREGYALYQAGQQFRKHPLSTQKDPQRSLEAFKVRLFFSLMFYAFEIQNDMTQSVVFYQRLDSSYLRDHGPLRLPWAGPKYALDHAKVTSFGSCKIQEAQKVRDYDQAINAMKLQEVELLKRRGQALTGEKRVKPECIRYAKFYLEQFFNYLCLAVQAQMGESSSSMSFSSNEEKIKEMWDKLCYSLCHSETSHLLSMSSHIFSTLTAFQALQKAFYDSVLLKKLNFESLIVEITERLKIVLADAWSIVQQQDDSDLSKVSPQVKAQLQEKLQTDHPRLHLQKLQLHLLRLANPEFLFLNAKQHSVGSGDQENVLLQSYFRSVFIIETLASIMKADFTQGTAQNISSVTYFLKCCDKVAKANPELLMKPYTHLVQFAFPYMLHLFAKIAKESLVEANQEKICQLADSELANYIGSCLSFFFRFKMDLEEIKLGHRANQPPGNQLPDEEMKSDKVDSGDDQEMSHFSSLLAPKKQQPADQASSGPTPLELFKKLALKGDKLDVVLLADLIYTVNFCCQGRLMEHSQMTAQDVKRTITLTEAVGGLVFSRRSWLQDRDPESKLRCNSVKAQFKEAQFDVELFKQGDYFDKTFQRSISTVLFYLLNMMTSIGLPTSASLLSGLSIAHRVSFLERLPSINDLKKLRALSHIDLQYGNGLEVTTLMMSYVFLQLYQESNESKIQTDYKGSDDYKNMKQMKNQAINSAISSINFILANPVSERAGWARLSQTELLKLAFKQLLQISILRIRGKQHVKFFDQRLELQSLERYMVPTEPLPHQQQDSKLARLGLLKQEAFLYATICGKLDSLCVPQMDPRAKKIPKEQLDAIGVSIARIFVDGVKATQAQMKQSAVVKSCGVIAYEQVDVCLAKIQRSVSSDQQLASALKVVPKSSLTFDYPYFQAQLKEEEDSLVTSEAMNNYKAALDIAVAESNAGGVFVAMLKIIEKSLRMATQLKYGGSMLTDELKFNYAKILENVTKQVLGDSSLKRFASAFAALAQDNFNQIIQDNQQKLGGLRADQHQPRTIEFQFDSDSIILEKHASSQIRPKLLKQQSMPEFNVYENMLSQLYGIADRFVYMLTASSQKLSAAVNPQALKYQDFQKLWLKVKYNQVLAKSLFFEYQAFSQHQLQPQQRASQHQLLSPGQMEGWVLIREMQSQTLKDMLNIDEIQQIYVQQQITQWGAVGTFNMNVISGFQGPNWQQLALNNVNSSLNQFFSVESEGTIKVDGQLSGLFNGKGDPKSLVGVADFNAFGFGILRAQVKHLQLEICKRSIEYEPIREISRKASSAFKQSLSPQAHGDVKSTSTEVQAVFMLSKDAFVTLLIQHVNQVYKTFCQVREDMKRVLSSANGQGYAQAASAYKEFRKNYAASRDHIPATLRDVFEAFVETHYSKQFLKKHDLISDQLRKTLRHSVLQISAVCGPDPELGGSANKVTSQFVNLAKITNDEYTYEGLTICIKWFAGVLDGTANSNQLAGAKQVRGGKNAIELQKRLLATLDEIQKSVSGVALPQGSYGSSTKGHTVQPHQVFKGN